MREKIKPCQCGSKNIRYSRPTTRRGNKTYWLLCCEVCGMNTGLVDTKQKAKNVWNYRPREKAVLEDVKNIAKEYREYEEQAGKTGKHSWQVVKDIEEEIEQMKEE
ncbi:hypothetical protein AKJ59_00865 [candidate division MSBL1 archaeon SCGC-AAA385M02]|uniref:Uncharacterized protein n=1 Tax=candidate division MSBL1 archaeon SCGC-AAA385M02 TaxID=1698287 RepID=A0A133VPU0_9EURY|nr:hypothetical protein AKJ59_00865 [candidate division MSBL1 archaeon SCGC-AAA385M02]